MESRKQQQVGSLIRKNLSEIFQRKGFSMFGRAMVTIYDVQITPDVMLARVYLSIYNTDDKQKVLSQVQQHTPTIKKDLVARIRNKMRRMPQIDFLLDDTLDRVDHMEDIFKQIKKDEEE